jgi:hypothetical protein
MRRIIPALLVLSLCAITTAAAPRVQRYLTTAAGGPPARWLTAPRGAGSVQPYLEFDSVEDFAHCSTRMLSVDICSCQTLGVAIPECSTPTIERKRNGKIRIRDRNRDVDIEIKRKWKRGRPYLRIDADP